MLQRQEKYYFYTYIYKPKKVTKEKKNEYHNTVDSRYLNLAYLE